MMISLAIAFSFTLRFDAATTHHHTIIDNPITYILIYPTVELQSTFKINPIQTHPST